MKLDTVLGLIGVSAALTVNALLLGPALAACGGSSDAWTHADSTSMTKAVQLAKGCDALCLSDGGCTAEQASACLEPIACNVGSALHRHGQPDLLDGGVTCRSQ